MSKGTFYTPLSQGAGQRRREEAARWFVTLQHTEPTPRVLRSWRKWEAVPENREAFNAVERVWKLTEAAQPSPKPSLQDPVDDEYDGAQSVHSWITARSRSARAPRQRLFTPNLRLAAATAAAVAGLNWVVSAYLGATTPDSRQISAETGVAEHKELTLEDGTRIYLGARTLVTTSFTPHTRNVVLHRGEALFEVAKDRSRPFLVDAGRGNITAVGTAFNVRRRADDQVIVTVTEGTVVVSPTPTVEESTRRHVADEKRGNPVQRVTRGKEIIFDPQGKLGPVRVAEANISAIWREGRLTYRSEPLRHVIEDINRYSPRQVIITDIAAGDLLYSGTVFERNIGDWIAALGKIYPEIEVISTDDRHVFIRTRDESTERT